MKALGLAPQMVVRCTDLYLETVEQLASESTKYPHPSPLSTRTSPLARQGKALPRSRANLTYQWGGEARGCYRRRPLSVAKCKPTVGSWLPLPLLLLVYICYTAPHGETAFPAFAGSGTGACLIKSLSLEFSPFWSTPVPDLGESSYHQPLL